MEKSKFKRSLKVCTFYFSLREKFGQIMKWFVGGAVTCTMLGNEEYQSHFQYENARHFWQT